MFGVFCIMNQKYEENNAKLIVIHRNLIYQNW